MTFALGMVIHIQLGFENEAESFPYQRLFWDGETINESIKKNLVGIGIVSTKTALQKKNIKGVLNVNAEAFITADRMDDEYFEWITVTTRIDFEQNSYDAIDDFLQEEALAKFMCKKLYDGIKRMVETFSPESMFDITTEVVDFDEW
jgi:hypothetical protein